MNDLEQRTQAIIEACVKEKETNPLAVFRHVAGQDFVRIHGPEHHVLDGVTHAQLNFTGCCTQNIFQKFFTEDAC